jgi:hypothetical protein
MQYDEILDDAIAQELTYTMNQMRKTSIIRYTVLIFMGIILYLQQGMWVSLLPTMIFSAVQLAQDIYKKRQFKFIYKIEKGVGSQANQIILNLVNFKGETKMISHSIERIEKTTLVKANNDTGQLLLEFDEEKKKYEILMKDFLKVFPQYLKINKYK